MTDLLDMAAREAGENENSERASELAPLLSGPLRAAVRDGYSPDRADRIRIRRGLERALAIPATASVQRVDLSMAQRMAAETPKAPLRFSWIRLRPLGLALSFGAAIGATLVLSTRSPERAPSPLARAPVTVATPALDLPAPRAQLAAASADAASDAPSADTARIAPQLAAHRRAKASSLVRRHQRQTFASEPAPASSAAPAQPIDPTPTLEREPTEARPSADLAEELRLLERASRQLSAHASNAALALLREHDRRFPNGPLGKESRALRVIALCESGADEASTERARFLRDQASSPMANRVRDACAER